MEKYFQKPDSRKSAAREWVLLLLLAVSTLSNIPISTAQTTSVKTINPETGNEKFVFHTSNMPSNMRFNATVWVYDVSDLFGYQVRLDLTSESHDNILNITGAWTPTWNSSWVFYGQMYMPLGPTFYDTDSDGYYEGVLVGATELAGATTFTGDGLLAIIEFEIIHVPSSGSVSCDLNIDNDNTKLTDSTVTVVPCTKIDGRYILTTGSFVDIYADPEDAVFGSSMNISGQVTPGVGDIAVTIWWKHNKTSASWNNLTTVLTDNSGYYVYEWTTDQLGALNIKANWTEAESYVILVNVRYGSTITLGLSDNNVTAGTNVTITGDIAAIIDSTPQPKDANVTIYYRCPNGAKPEWTTLATNITTTAGHYQYIWTATKSIVGSEAKNNTIEFYASWEGDNETQGAESFIQELLVWKQHVTITINVEPQIVLINSYVTIYGETTPALVIPGCPPAYLRLRYNAGQLWQNDSTSYPVDEQGKYNFTWKVDSAKVQELGKFWFLIEFTHPGVTNSEIYIKDFFKAESPNASITVTGYSSNITLKVEPQTTVAYSNVVFSGRITCEKQTVPPLQKVSILYETAGGWLTLTEEAYATNETGHYSFTWNATMAGELKLKASWGGYGNIVGAESEPVTLTVQRLEPSLTLEVDPQNIKIGHNVTIRASLSPPVNGTTIFLYYRNASGGEWIRLAYKGTVLGNISYVWTPNITGTFELRAYCESFKVYNAINSTVVTVNVTKYGSTITINVDPETIKIGGNITISGYLSLEQGAPGDVNNMTIIIQYKNASNGEWKVLATRKTNAEGYYSFVWYPNHTGNFTVKVSWAGDHYHESATATATVTVETTPQENYFLIYITAGAIIAAVVIVAAFILLKKRK